MSPCFFYEKSRPEGRLSEDIMIELIFNQGDGAGVIAHENSAVIEDL
jgi:hypothetical protein